MIEILELVSGEVIRVTDESDEYLSLTDSGMVLHRYTNHNYDRFAVYYPPTQYKRYSIITPGETTE